jgi:hypothetical protein
VAVVVEEEEVEEEEEEEMVVGVVVEGGESHWLRGHPMAEDDTSDDEGGERFVLSRGGLARSEVWTLAGCVHRYCTVLLLYS